MADNVTLPGTGTVVATDEVAGVHWQQMKLAYGGDGAATAVDTAAPLPVTVAGTISGATISAVPASVTSVSLLAARPARRGVVVVNDGAATLYLAFAATASTTAYSYKMPPNATFEMPVPPYGGAISAIWSDAVGSARVTELF
jgi:hypothetical protein